jgi:hypothetical protein
MQQWDVCVRFLNQPIIWHARRQRPVFRRKSDLRRKSSNYETRLTAHMHVHAELGNYLYQ